MAIEKHSEPRTSGCCCPGFGKRHVLALVSSCGFMVVYALRVNLSVALVAMVNNTAFAARIDPNDTADEQCLNLEAQNSSYSWAEQGEFNWGPKVQGIILGAFFYGYLTTQILGGYLADRFGGKWLFGVGILVTAVLTIVSPFAARRGHSYLVAVRVLEGIGEGVTYPAMYAMWGRWAPKLERSTLTALSYCGSPIGTIIAFPISGVMCEYGFDGGWPSLFYVFGSLGCVWFLFWCYLAHNSPEDHPTISAQERHYILSSVGHVGASRSVPWKAMLTNRPVIALCVTQFCGGWGFYTILTSLPTYMKEILKLNMTSNGVTSALPYTLGFFISILSGYLADLLQKKEILSTTLTRKLMTSISMFGAAGCMMAVTLVGCNRLGVIALLTCSVGIYGATSGGNTINQLDLAPNYAGVLMGVSNTIGTVPGVVGPLVTGVLTNDKQSLAEWNLVFIISGVIFLFGLVVFVLFGSGDEQSWAVTKQTLISTVESDSDPDDEDSPTPGFPAQVNSHSINFDNHFEEGVDVNSVPQVNNSNVIM